MSSGDRAPPFDIDEDQRAIRALARRVAEEVLAPRALEWEEDGRFPAENIEVLAETGLIGATIPESYGGSGGSWLEAALILEELGRCCYSTAMAALGELGVQTQAIVRLGSEGQRRRYLPEVAAGRLICAITITEPDVGSDVSAIRTAARKDGNHYVVNGTKMLISRADVAGLFLVYVRFDDVPGAKGIGSILIEGGSPGLRVNEGYHTLGGERLFEVQFEDCKVPAERVLVREDGLRRMLSAFNGQRCLNGSISVGIAQGAQDAALEQVTSRKQGGQRVADYQGIRWALAENAMQLEAARLLVWRAAARTAGGFPSRYESAIAKTSANEMALRVTDSAMQMFGGHGWLKEMPIERYVRWARYGPLGGGTPHIQKNGIARELLKPYASSA